jgi:hypothetical protein
VRPRAAGLPPNRDGLAVALPTSQRSCTVDAQPDADLERVEVVQEYSHGSLVVGDLKPDSLRHRSGRSVVDPVENIAGAVLIPSVRVPCSQREKGEPLF